MKSTMRILLSIIVVAYATNADSMTFQRSDESKFEIYKTEKTKPYKYQNHIIKIDSIGLSYDPCAYKFNCNESNKTLPDYSSKIFENFSPKVSRIEACKRECDADHDVGVQMCLVHSPAGSQSACIAQVMNVYGACLKRCG